MLLLLIVINILSYVDRHMLPAFASQITADLELTRQQFGLLTGFAFRPVLVPLTFTMLVAAFVGHAGKGFSAQAGGMEYPLTLAAAGDVEIGPVD